MPSNLYNFETPNRDGSFHVAKLYVDEFVAGAGQLEGALNVKIRCAARDVICD